MFFSAGPRPTLELNSGISKTTSFLMIAAAWGAIASGASAAVTVTHLETSLLQGDASSEFALPGAGTSTMFPTRQSYDVHYGGAIERVDRLYTADGRTFTPTGAANLVVRRNSGPNNDILWYRGLADTGQTDLHLDSQKAYSVEEAFGGNNLLVGADNFFSNQGDGKHNNSNIERLDFIFTNGITATDERGFSIYDRGNAFEHDAFKIVAITSLDDDNTPNGFGAVLSFERGQWGNVDLVPTSDYIMMRKDLSDDANPYRPSNIRHQSIGGVFIYATDLVDPGATFYGFALLAPDTLGQGADLADWTNPNHYPTDTLDTDRHGGLDPIGASAVLFSAEVPEPSTAAFLGIAALLAIRRRSCRPQMNTNPHE